jgi:peptidoglycan/xylan/chitin deacetylase (PgdA/CDA1 family)
MNKTLVPLLSKRIFITLDDGYESNYKYAYPILKT